jgi:hypothetical protein
MTFGSLPLSQRPWWTDADQAELDRVLWEYVSVYDEHRGVCPVRSCEHLTPAWEAIEEWLTVRKLQSRAEWCRRERRLDDLAEIQALLNPVSPSEVDG